MSALKRLGIGNIEEDIRVTNTMAQTQRAFDFKWRRRDSYESEAVRHNTKRWLFERYCSDNPDYLTQWLSGGRKIILDVGCGSGVSGFLFFSDHLKYHDYLGVEISDSVEIARERFANAGYDADFLQMDFMQLPVADESIHFIFSEGVLHHTDDTEKAIKFLSKKLCQGGRFLFYVYKKKAIIREFTDDYVREQLENMTEEKAWEALKPLTRLGTAFGEKDIEINIPEDIPLLKIKKGKIGIQRFIYWNICKLFYHPEYTLEEMNHVNFDWFRPLNCHRHTPEEIRRWCAEADLDIEHFNIQESGMTVVAQKLI